MSEPNAEAQDALPYSMRLRGDDHRAMHDAFRWHLPSRYNMAVDLIDRVAAATPDAIGLIHETEAGDVTRYSFARLRSLAARAANVFAALGAARGDRIASLLNQSPEALLVHLGCWRAGLVSVPISISVDAETLAARLAASGARIVVTDLARYPRLAEIRDQLPEPIQTLLIDGCESDAAEFHALLANASESHAAAATGPDDLAFLSFTSGSTGQSKGVAFGHRMLPGHLPGFAFAYEHFGQAEDLCWTPADWAGGGGLSMSLMPCLWFGKPAVAFRSEAAFDPERAFATMLRHGVRNLFAMPTMINLLRQGKLPPGLRLRSFISAGEAVGAELAEWSRAAFGIHVNAVYGQSEANFLLAHVPAFMPERPGSMGLPVPGCEIGVIDARGAPLPDGATGQLALKRPHPVMMLGYWNDRAETRARYAGDWLLTGDLVSRDGEGYYWYRGRPEDLIQTVAGTVAPFVIEEAFTRSPSVAVAAAIGVPVGAEDQRIKVFLQPPTGVGIGAREAAEIENFARTRLAVEHRPQAIEFVDVLPLTSTGKVARRVLRERERARRDGVAEPDNG